MAGPAVWWLVAALAAPSWRTVLGGSATWRGCSSRYDAIAELGVTDDSVTALHLTDCNITAINLDHLKCYPNLDTLFLANNKISQIEAGTFDSFSQLGYLDLNFNAFLGKNLPHNLFSNWHPSDSISLSFVGNDMSGTPADLLQGLDVRYLMLTNCSLREFPSFVKRPVFYNMFQLELDHNAIEMLDDPETFGNMIYLANLRVSHNKIDQIHPNLLKPFAHLYSINMDYNRISYIPDALFQNKSLQTIELSHNRIEYVSVNAFLGTELRTLSLNYNRLTFLPGNFLSDLQGAGVTLNMFHFDRNPWECACLNEVLIEVKKLNIRYLWGNTTITPSIHEPLQSDAPVCSISDRSFKCHRKEFYQTLYDNNV